jgi:hypothetical protein
MKCFASAALAATALLASATASAEPSRGDDPSESTAFLLSAGPAALGAGLIVAGIVAEQPTVGLSGVGVLTVGPSIGHYYTGDVGRGLLTTGVRAAGFTVMTLGALASSCFDDSCGQDDLSGELAMAGGALLVVGATVYDIVDARPSARRHRSAVTETPTLLPSAPAADRPGRAAARSPPDGSRRRRR